MKRAVRPWTAFGIILGLLVPSATGRAQAGQVLFTFVQISDSQPNDALDQLRFEEVIQTIAAGGQPGALLPRPVELVIFPGDCVWGASEPEWISFVQTMDVLTAAGIPYIVVPGNHDQDNGGVGLYEQYVGDSGVWDFGSAIFTGHNGLTHATGWAGLRFIGFNNSNGAWNVISPEDLAEIDARIAAAVALGENVLLVGHHPHNGQGLVPLQATLEVPDIVAYMRGHSGNPHANHGLSGIANPNVWDLDSNAIYDEAALIYCEVFTTEIQAHVVELVLDPPLLPPAETIPLVHPLVLAFAVPPQAGFNGQPRLGPQPLAVSFANLSTGSPTSWDWDFGDGTGATVPSPLHVYNDPGSYSVTLTVANSAGVDTLTISDFIIVEPAVVFTPVADSKVNSSNPSTNYGTEPDLRCRDGGVTQATYQSYLKFEVGGIGGAPVPSAFLRLYVTDGSDDGGTLYGVESAWTETGITFASAPVIGGAALGSAGPVESNTWIEFDVASVVTGEGTYAFGLTSSSSNSVFFSSREGLVPPQLVLLGLNPLCGNGLIDPGEDCATCPGDVPCPPGFGCANGICEALCGNGLIDPGENCANCPADIQCPPGHECIAGACQPLCGNGLIDPGENCATCPPDVPCGPGEECAGGVCQPICGNGAIDPGENCATCPPDMPCPPGEECIGDLCVPLCGNGTVDPGEDCSNCPEDVSCPPGNVCVDGICDRLCGNGTVDPGEDCSNCPEDVSCPPGNVCVDGMCDRLCGNGTADPGEECANCPADVPCPPGTECISGLCESQCGNGVPDPGEDCANCPVDVQCPPGHECNSGTCQPLCGNGLIDPGEDCATCPGDVPCGPGASCEGGACVPACPLDLDGDGSVAVVDLLDLLANWGPNPGHPADVDLDGTVGVVDFLELLAQWGPCP